MALSASSTSVMKVFTFSKMLPSLVSILLIFTVFRDVSAASSKLPSNFPYCKRSDPALAMCLQRAIPPVLIELRKGIPALGLPSMDPADISAIEVPQGQGPVSLSMKFRNVRLKGFSRPTVESTSIEFDPKMMIKYFGTIPKIDFESDYEMNGRILVLPVTGKGRCHLTFTNLRAKVGPVGTQVEKKGKKYFNIEDFFTDLKSTDKLEFHFDNLFNGDKTLGDNMNVVMNDNWKELWEEMKPVFIETFKSYFLKYSKAIFDKIPINEIFEE